MSHQDFLLFFVVQEFHRFLLLLLKSGSPQMVLNEFKESVLKFLRSNVEIVCRNILTMLASNAFVNTAVNSRI